MIAGQFRIDRPQSWLNLGYRRNQPYNRRYFGSGFGIDKRPGRISITTMSGSGGIDEQELEIPEQTLRRIRERVLQAEKEKLHLDLPRGINNEIEEIIREEIN